MELLEAQRANISHSSASLANSLLLLSQTQAKSALSLKGIVKLSEAELRQIFPSTDADGKSNSGTATTMTQKDRLRAAVRGALGSRHPHEEDISDSQFLGRASSDPPQSEASPSPSGDPSPAISMDDEIIDDERGTLLSEGQDSNNNAVDEMYVSTLGMLREVAQVTHCIAYIIIRIGWNWKESFEIWTWR